MAASAPAFPGDGPTVEHGPLHQVAGQVLTPRGFVPGVVSFNRTIHAISLEAGAEPTADVPGSDPRPRILPGFIDLHLHGGGGADVMDGADAAATVGRLHAQHGTTAWLATTMTAPAAEVEAALQGVAQVMRELANGRHPGVADVLGVHLEGPFLSPNKLGAQPPDTCALDTQLVQSWSDVAKIRLITLAPEAAGDLSLVRALVTAGFRVQLGHSNASYEQALATLQAGATGFTHLFNAMSPLHHREPGLVGAALAHATHAEIIADLTHVHPGAIQVALRCVPGLFCVSDATAATGMPDGAYQLGRQTVHKCLGAVRLADGTLAGSTLTLDQALRNLVQLGVPLGAAAQRCSTVPAGYLGLSDRGLIAPGLRADVVLLDADLRVQEVFIAGRRVQLHPTT